ncbi:outer membrane efflux protein [Solidesulfovibrio carbinoliphilus subsp. oakridgensis]|uniref:Outer membrane efflux protein n=1 Tax=Solidesulfovibrio carbinoliphilus subsp. oakridgensis TaxID=694327 RepID=G7Q896_9BACT|nr:TolC family protein [Solidesulfovibrio carbinoliphilus]EHJ48110.1 outer membrane efflux protein [Solidesulfovibrio carbinoliphilus subsp. oakridgensis]
MTRDLTYGQRVGTPGGGVSGRGGKAGGARLATAVMLCLALLLGAMPVRAAPGDRYTKDKVKGASAPAAQAPAAPAARPATAANDQDDDASMDFARSKGSGMALGAVTVKSPADFQECVRVALAQSPLLTKSSIEIESKRLDVGDAYSQYIPTIVMSTTFYMRLPEYKNLAGTAWNSYAADNASSNPAQNLSNSITAANAIYAGNSANRSRKAYDLNFSTGAWNPLLTAFDVQAKKEMVNIAVLSHLKVIDQGLKRLGTIFLQLGMVDTMIKMAKEKEDLAVKNLEYVKTRAGLGQGAELDVRIAETKINLAKAEGEKMRTSKSVLLDELKFVMGVPFVQKVDLSLANASKQVLEDFNPAGVSDETLRRHSFQLRIHEYEKGLQKKNIALSYIHFLPTFSFGFTSVSTLNSTSYKDDTSSLPFMYPNLTLNFPFDLWTKARDVSRQYKKMAQLNVEGRNLEFTLMSQFQQALAKLRSANSDVKFAASSVELQKLTAQQAQFRFESGQAEYDAIVRSMSEYLDSRQNLLMKEYDRDVAMLDVRSISGDFQDRYINVSIMESL